MQHPLALAHLTLLGSSPPTLIEVAGEAGFTMVGVRVLPATSAEVRYPLGAGTPLLARTRRALAATGITVLDVEALSLDGTMNAEQWLPALETAAELGAMVLNVIGSDPDRSRLIESFSSLCSDADQHGIRASLEPISYQPVATVFDAIDVVEASGCGGMMLDTLHFHRAGSVPEDVSRVPGSLFSVVQLSDGPISPRTDVSVPEYDPMAQAGESSPRIIESRVLRDLPGHGVFPLTEILRRVPAGIPVSVEVPNPRLIAEIGPVSYAKRAHAAARKTLNNAHSVQPVE